MTDTASPSATGSSGPSAAGRPAGGRSAGGRSAGIYQPANVSLLGGEMLTWSDTGLGGTDAPVLTHLVDGLALAGNNVLVAGPHHADLIDLLAERFADLTCLLRSYPDARTLGDGNLDRTGFRVHCGAPEKFTTSMPFDAVVALDGFRRLPSADGADLTWEETFVHLSNMVAPGGSLLLAVENELGVHRLSGATGPDEFDWRPVADHTRPTRLGGLAARLETAGFALDRAYCVFPYLDEATVLLGSDLLDGTSGGTEVPAAVAAAACARTFAGQSVLSDPRRLTEQALLDGLGCELAPAWIVVARRTSGRAVTSPRPQAEAVLPAAPAALVADGAREAGWNVAYELRPDAAGGWTRSLRTGGTAAEGMTRPIMVGRVGREPGRLSDPVPAGRVLEGVLLDACAREDTSRLRETLRAFAEWVKREIAGGRPPGEMLFATTDNVVVGGAGFAVLDPSRHFTESISADLLLCRILRGFAVRLLGGGHRHAWPPSTDADTLAITFCAMAGHPVDRRVPAEVVWLEAEITAASHGLSRLDEQRLVQELSEAGTSSYNPRSHRDTLEANGRLHEELHAARLTIEWLEKLLVINDNRLRAARHQVTLRDRRLRAIRRSAGYRCGRIVTAPARLPRRLVRMLLSGRAPAGRPATQGDRR